VLLVTEHYFIAFTKFLHSRIKRNLFYGENDKTEANFYRTCFKSNRQSNRSVLYRIFRLLTWMNPNRDWNLPITDKKCTVCRLEVVIDCSRDITNTFLCVIDTSSLMQQWRNQAEKWMGRVAVHTRRIRDPCFFCSRTNNLEFTARLSQGSSCQLRTILAGLKDVVLIVLFLLSRATISAV